MIQPPMFAMVMATVSNSHYMAIHPNDYVNSGTQE